MLVGFEAVVFDIGGVCVRSPFEGIAEFEQKHGLPRNYINVAISIRGDRGAFQRLERGEIETTAFYDDFGAQLSDEAVNIPAYVQYAARKGGAWAISREEVERKVKGKKIDGKVLFGDMMRKASEIEPIMWSAVRRLRESGRYKVGALTNNFNYGDDPELSRTPEFLIAHFDEFVESRLVGLRKPDPRIYLLACERLGVKPEQVIFLDDIGENLRAAKSLGMTTVRVHIGRPEDAVRELEQLVGLPLLEKGHKL
ncbi:epoxide hydrolase [Cladochytrium replicatum]|nr:epoxide hydrolase [Cladochytrium replicatum]